MRLSAPSMLFFVISLVLAVAAIAARFGGVSIPWVSAGHQFETMLAAWVVLAIGSLFRGA